MKISLIIFSIGILFFGYHFFQVQRKIAFSKEMVKNTKPYQHISDDDSNSVLVLGDSTAVGIGATVPEDSVPALYSNFLGASYVENKAVSGSKIEDVAKQVEDLKKKKYTSILLQVGANDIVAFHDKGTAEQALRTLLPKLPPHERLTVLICGNVGSAKLIPWFLRGLYTKQTLAYHALYERVVPEFGGEYVNLYVPRENDPFIALPEVYLAKDEFHPSSAGYALWFEKIMTTLEKE